MNFSATSKKPFLIGFVAATLSLSSCQEDTPGGGPGTASRFERFESCQIISPPSEVELSSYYTKYTNCNGIPIIGNNDVPDDAFNVGIETIDFMLNGLESVRNKLIQRGEYYILVPPGGNPRDVPEFANAPGNVNSGIYWDQPRCGASNAAGLLCMAEDNPDGHANVMIHEMVHMISIGGYQKMGGSFGSELTQAFNNAVSQGLWSNTYARTNKEEYLAVCVQIFYEVGFPFVTDPAGDGNWNHIVTRAQLQQYDPTIYNFIDTYFNSSDVVPGCIDGENYEYWEDPSINCGSTVTDIDGNVYNVVRIGNACWMKENLKTTRYRNGATIPNVNAENDWISQGLGAWCSYNNDNGNVDTYGRLYNWYAVNNAAGVCPDGWHVATQEEWQSLMQVANSYGNGTGGALKSTDLLWIQPNDGATNETGFTALPAGIRRDDGLFDGIEGHTSFWSSAQDGGTNAWSYNIWHNGNFTLEQSHAKIQGKSCRCVKD